MLSVELSEHSLGAQLLNHDLVTACKICGVTHIYIYIYNIYTYLSEVSKRSPEEKPWWHGVGKLFDLILMIRQNVINGHFRNRLIGGTYHI